MFWHALFSVVVNEELIVIGFPSRKSNYIEWIQSSLSYQIHLVRGSENFPDEPLHYCIMTPSTLFITFYKAALYGKELKIIN